MAIQQTRDGGVHIVQIDGELDAFEVQTLREELEFAVQQPAEMHALDLAQVTLVDSSGIGLLVFLYKTATARQIPFALIGLTGQPREMIQFLKIDRRVPTFDAVDDARSALLRERA